MPKRYPQDQRERAVWMVLDHLSEYASVFAACSGIGPKLNIGRESLRRWVLQAQIDVDERPGAIFELSLLSGRESVPLGEEDSMASLRSDAFKAKQDPKWSAGFVRRKTNPSRPAAS